MDNPSHIVICRYFVSGLRECTYYHSPCVYSYNNDCCDISLHALHLFSKQCMYTSKIIPFIVMCKLDSKHRLFRRQVYSLTAGRIVICLSPKSSSIV
jgi:hypothetical protein